MGMKFQDSTTFNQSTWNNGTAQNSGVAVYGWGYCTALVTLHYSGSVSTGVITFEGYDGYNWFPIIPVSQINSSTAPTTTTFSLSSSAGDTGFYCNINAFSSFRVRLSTVISSAGSVLVNINASAATSNTV